MTKRKRISFYADSLTEISVELVKLDNENEALKVENIGLVQEIADIKAQLKTSRKDAKDNEVQALYLKKELADLSSQIKARNRTIIELIQENDKLRGHGSTTPVSKCLEPEKSVQAFVSASPNVTKTKPPPITMAKPSSQSQHTSKVKQTVPPLLRDLRTVVKESKPGTGNVLEKSICPVMSELEAAKRQIAKLEQDKKRLATVVQKTKEMRKNTQQNVLVHLKTIAKQRKTITDLKSELKIYIEMQQLTDANVLLKAANVQLIAAMNLLQGTSHDTSAATLNTSFTESENGQRVCALCKTTDSCRFIKGVLCSACYQTIRRVSKLMEAEPFEDEAI
ncbi:hypothetical protein HDE_11271 [Halotydeus destructor]|nr:hypothetical protein HDE_11271 [Halotydeus destructor]